MAIRSVEPTGLAPVTTAPWRPSLVSKLTALVPFGLVAAQDMLFPVYLAVPMFGPPKLLGVPVDLGLLGVGLGWAAIGAWILWRARSPWVALGAVLAFTMPSLLVLLLGPAAILIIQNMLST